LYVNLVSKIWIDSCFFWCETFKKWSSIYRFRTMMYSKLGEGKCANIIMWKRKMKK
jgi:hypothetical protein